MCGFAGFCTNNPEHSKNGVIIAKKMSSLIRHRGPDSEGVFSDGFFSAGFCRLKIIDLDGGDQPMSDVSGRYVLCFNGEIYNYKSLREELISAHGIRFSTSSDTEVLLYACIVHGHDVLRHLRGMYSFVFYDKKEKSIFCARDPFGIKPFYYGFFGNSFLFSSEIKAFYAHPDFTPEFNSDVLPLYLQFQYVPVEESAFRGVKRLLPGHCLEYNGKKINVTKFFDHPTASHGKFRSYSFFNAPVTEQKQTTSLNNSTELLRGVISESVQTHLNADVSVGTFLSGGVDSAYVTALAKPQHSYTVGFEDYGFDERTEASENARTLGVALTEISVAPGDFFRALPMVQYHSDEPCANLSAVPLFLLAERASSDVKVILSGEGADELFAGYDLYNPGIYSRLYRRLPHKFRAAGKRLKLPTEKLRDFVARNAPSVEDSFIGQARIMPASTAYSLLSKKYKQLRTASEVTYPHYKAVKESSELQKKLYLDRQLWMPFDILNKADKMTMAHSIELRVPYLDLKVLGVAQTLSDRLLIHGKQGKYALRVASKPYIGKRSALRPKKGFPVPFRNWIKMPEYCEMLRTVFDSPTCAEFFEQKILKKMLDDHVSGTENNARILYTVYSFIIWYDVYFRKSRPSFFTANINESADSEILKSERYGKGVSP